MRFDNGIKYYTKGKAEIDVFFPENRVACYYCRFCYGDSIGRTNCTLTGKLVANAKDGIDGDCPIIFEEEKKDEV